jgi:hypothetical protein
MTEPRYVITTDAPLTAEAADWLRRLAAALGAILR